MTSKLLRITVLLALLAALLRLPLGAAAQSGTTFFVTEVDATAFPTVQFTLRAIDLNNQAVSGLSSANLAVFENGQSVSEVEVTTHTDGPVHWVFVIDQGRAANYTQFGLDRIRNAITTIVSGGYFKDGVDTVQVLARTNVNSDQTTEVLPVTQVATDLTTWAANYNFAQSRNFTKALLGVEDALTELNQQVPVPGTQAAAIILFTRYIEDPARQVAVTTAQNTAALAKANYTPVHVVQTDLNQANKDALQVLASASLGQFQPIDRNNFATVMANLYKVVDSQRTYYTVTYKSVLGESGARQITINSAERPAAGVVGTYEISLQPPAVAITGPAAGSVLPREAQFGADGVSMVFDADRVPVSAEAAFPDGVQRALTSAQLSVNGAVEDTAQIAPGQTRFEFTWDISDIVQQGRTSIELEVTVTDEFGLAGAAQSSVSVDVILPATPTPTPTPSVLSNSVVVGGGIAVVCVIGLGLLVIVGVVFFVLRPRTRPAAPAPAAAVSRGEVQNTIIAGAAVLDRTLATLTVLEGPKGLIGESIKVLKATTVIGRNPKATDITFYADEESSVSRIHATLQQDLGGAFKLTDNGSSSGTRLNGRQIKANDPVTLSDGDEIVLGDLGRRGVKLRFGTASPEAARYSGPADDRTHIISRPDDTGGDGQADNWEKFSE
jgi:pSer/pThr/pTyr-binding forkhead associated (FHA) protein